MLKASLNREIQRRLTQLVKQGAAPGFQLTLGFKNRTLGTFVAGVRDPRSQALVRRWTWFDLASLTKIIMTVDGIMMALHERKLENLSQPLKVFFPFLSSELKERNLADLLNHRSGLLAVFVDVQDFATREEKIRHILHRIDQTYCPPVESKAVYSDVGFMLLGIILEQIYGKRLRDILSRRSRIAYGPLAPISAFWADFFRRPHPAAILELESKSRWLEGRCQDPRADWLEGDAGHAGLFGTSEGVESWGRELYMCYHGKGLRYSDRVVREFISFEGHERGSYLNGFDTPAVGNVISQAGRRFSEFTIGHMGYTGTSFWMDIERGFRVTLLSHRFAPGLNIETLRALRPDFHDWLHAEVFSKLES